MNKDKALKLFEPYDNIIFDYGGIFFDIDYEITIQEFSKLGSNINFNELFSKKKQTDLFDLFETGKISKKEFIDQLQL